MREQSVVRNGLRLAALLGITLSFAALISGTASASKSPDAVIAQELQAQLKVKNLPKDLEPGLYVTNQNIYAVGGAAYATAACSPYSTPSQAYAPKPCWYGDLKSSKIIAIWGDSMALNWIPALDVVGKHQHWKVAMYSFSGCVPADVSSGAPGGAFNATQIAACGAWHSTLPKAIRAIGAKVVIGTNATPTLGFSADTAFMQGLRRVWDRMDAPGYHPTRLMMGFTPHLKWNVPACLSTHRTAIDFCTMHYSLHDAYGYGPTVLRDNRMQQIVGVTIIPTARWFCYQGACPVVLTNKLVFVDGDHTTIKFSLHLAPAFEAALLPYLK